MSAVAILSAAFLVGGMMGFFFAPVLAMGKEPVDVVETQDFASLQRVKGETDIVSIHEDPGWRMVYGDPEMEKWESRTKKGRGGDNGKEKTGRYEAGQLG
ncbi:MAG: hypothetical protein HY998_08580 [candidate division NC10 bacterium]|nr:hypothetical protein [candidate division NC10 bacterium]